MKSLHPPHHRKTFLLQRTKSDWWLNPQTHLKTHEGNRRKRKRWSRRWGSGRGKREAGRNILDVSDVFIGLGWCRKVKRKQATQSEASSFHHNHQPSHMNHEPWSEIELFTSCHFFSPWSEKRFTQLTPWTPEKQDEEKLPKERTQAIKTYIFALCYIYTPFSEVACAKIKILKLFAVNSRVDFFSFFFVSELQLHASLLALLCHAVPLVFLRKSYFF